MEDGAFQAQRSAWAKVQREREQVEETEARVTGARTPSSLGSNHSSLRFPRPFSQKDSPGNSGALQHVELRSLSGWRNPHQL